MTTQISEAFETWMTTQSQLPNDVDWEEVFTAGWKAAIEAVAETLTQAFDNFTVGLPSLWDDDTEAPYNDDGADYPEDQSYDRQDIGRFNGKLYAEE